MELSVIVEPADRIAVKLRANAVNERRVDAKAVGADDAATTCTTIVGAVDAQAKLGWTVDIGAAARRMAR